MKWLFKPLGRAGFAVCLPFLALLWLAAFILVNQVLQRPGNSPDAVAWIYLAYSMIWYIPSIIVQLKRLRSIGLPIWMGAIFAVFAPATLLGGIVDWMDFIVPVVWVLALVYARPGRFRSDPESEESGSGKEPVADASDISKD